MLQDMICGWSNELRLAWRAVDKTPHLKEFAESTEVADGAAGTDAAQAVWKDGSRADICEVSGSASCPKPNTGFGQL
eukprot:9826263-Alexandrium_andersonii.AAC.1